MAIPGINTTILDGQIGIVAPSTGGASVTIGVCSDGVPLNLYGGYQADLTRCRTDLGYGPGVEALAYKIAMGGGPHYFLPITPNYDGAASAVTSVKTGTGTVAVSFGPRQQIIAKCTTGGALGTAQFTFQIGSGAPSAPVVSAAGWASGFVIPGTMTKGTFTAGTYVLNDFVTLATTGGTPTNSGGYASPAITFTSQPFDDYTFKVQCVQAGALGAGTFKWCLDNFADDSGNDLSNWSAETLIPGGGLYAVPNTGVVLTFASTFAAGDYYTFTTIASGFTTGNVTTALSTLFGLAVTNFAGVHVAGMPASSGNAATLASTVDSSVVALEPLRRFNWALTDCPTSGTRVLSGGLPISDSADTDTAVASAFASTTSKRVGTGAGDALAISAITGRLCRRPASWWAAGRATGKSSLAWTLQRVKSGALPFIVKLYRDESKTQALDAARLITLCSQPGKVGYFITRGQTLADKTSDFSSFARRQVMDEACRVVVAAAADLIGDTVVLNANGTISSADASAIESSLTAKVVTSIVDPKFASGASVVVDRTHNIAADSTIYLTVKIIPLGELNTIALTIGYAISSTAASA